MRLRPMPSTAGRTLEMLEAAAPARSPVRAQWKRAASAVSVPTKSYTVSHEVAILESTRSTERAGSITEEHLGVSFRIFDELLPQSGLLQRALKLLRDELFDAVYSDEYSTDDAGKVTRVPYFVLAGRLQKARNGAAEAAAREAADTAIRLNGAQEEATQVRREVGALKKTGSQLRGEIDSLKAELLMAQQRVDTADVRLAAREAALRAEVAEVRRQAGVLEAALTETRAALVAATRCSNAFAKMEQLFMEPFEGAEKRREQGTRAVATQQLAMARTHEAQLLMVRNRVVAELDAALLQPVDASPAQKRYDICMNEVVRELALTRESMDEHEGTVAILAKRTPEHFETGEKFHPTPGLLGRYSVRLLASGNGGSTFAQVRGFGELCACCGARATECPRTPAGGFATVVLPPRSTHLRVERVAPAAATAAPARPKTAPSSGPSKLGPLWAEFRRRPAVPCAPQSTSLVLTLQLAEQLMRRLVTADRMWATGTVGGNGALPAPQSPQQTLFAVLETRYGHTEVATVAGEGLLMTLAAANDDEQLLLQLVRSVLCGDRDAAYLRYFSRVRGLLRTVSAEQAGELLQDLYPDLPPDKLDELLLELTSLVGSAAVTPKAVEDFVLVLLARGTEPNMLAAAAALERYVLVRPDAMAMEEFRSFARALGPTLDDALLERLFVETMLTARLLGDDPKASTIVAERGAEIVAYALFDWGADDTARAIADRVAGTPEWKRKRLAQKRRDARAKADRKSRADARKSGAGASAALVRAEAIERLM